MDNKYRVPAVEKADAVLQAIADRPHRLRLIDLSAELGIHKSSLFSLLATMEALRWVIKDDADTYALGSAMARFGGAYARHNDLVRAFHREAPAAAAAIGETVQLARLEGTEVLYLAKEEVPSPIRLASDPGMKFPAHATALGKALLSGRSERELHALYPEPQLQPLTPYGITAVEALLQEVEQARRGGCAFDLQEAVIGFCCVAAPIRDARGDIAAAVSASMPVHMWESKRDAAREHIVRLAARLSNL
ncbi:IclR family transcriptional regulator [Gordoniibacillus kamchatkensis]|uniref:IclR family transcriptional regulator n=1 Tax=Gordoniibacillus kamchatkensis TaxID=1590651 RepID=A0ABR5AKD1_9BACL|nr:IclR family transcriptional regulator [Paenibacillus sp. VKM B-2647]KIL41479.1 IclR family transcriptional regulator [Paenibacillus sp. VKM B-2647]